MNTSPRRVNAGQVVGILEMNFGGNKYYIQFASTGKKRKYFMHDMHKLAVYVAFPQTTSKKGINKHVYKAVAAMYK